MPFLERLNSHVLAFIWPLSVAGEEGGQGDLVQAIGICRLLCKLVSPHGQLLNLSLWRDHWMRQQSINFSNRGVCALADLFSMFSWLSLYHWSLEVGFSGARRCLTWERISFLAMKSHDSQGRNLELVAEFQRSISDRMWKLIWRNKEDKWLWEWVTKKMGVAVTEIQTSGRAQYGSWRRI